MKKGYLILENGLVFEGVRFGADADALGELVANTAMVGYLETLTDPGCAGQIVMQTFPLIGNYGIIEADFEGPSAALGYVVHEACAFPSNFRAQYALDKFLKDRGIPGLTGVETRDVTRALREAGPMNAMIADRAPEDLSLLQSHRVRDLVPSVSTREKRFIPAAGPEKFRVALMDYGTMAGVARALTSRGCAVTVYPHDTRAADVLAQSPDGIVLDGGPGDPAESKARIAQVKELAGKKPLLGIGLGHQLLALSMGAEAERLRFGHRGANLPVRDLKTGRTYITSQNSGYAIMAESIRAGVLRYVNANDGSCAGIDYPDIRAFGVQFRPEASLGVGDADGVLKRFISRMEGK